MVSNFFFYIIKALAHHSSLVVTLLMVAPSVMAQTSIKIDEKLEYHEIGPKEVSFWLPESSIKIREPDYKTYLSFDSIQKKKVFLEKLYDSYYSKGNQPSADSVLGELLNGNFNVSTEGRPNFGVVNKPIWYSLTIDRSPTEALQEFYLVITGYFHDMSTYRVESDSLEKIIRTGSVYPLETRAVSYPDQSFVIPLRLQPGENRLLIQTFGVVNNPKLEIYRADTYHSTKNRYYILLCMCVGALLGMIIYNFCIFVMSRQSTYFFYVMYMLTELCFLTYKTHIYTYLLPDNHVVYWRTFFTIGLVGGLICGLLFVRSFLKLYQYKWIDRFWAMTLGVVLMIAGFFEVSGIDPVAAYIELTLVVYILQFSLGCYLALRGNREAVFYLIAFSVFIFSIIIYTGSLVGKIEHNSIVLYGAEIGAAVQAMLLSLSMAYKIRIMNIGLEAYIGKIETLVEKRTRHINSFLKNIKQGIFDVLPGLVIGPYHSEYCSEIFAGDIIEGENVIDLLRKRSSIDDDRLSRTSNVLSLALGEDLLGFQCNSDHLPKELVWNDHTLELDWQPVVQKDGTIEKVMVVAKDVTDIRVLQAQSIVHSKQMQRLESLINIDPHRCKRMLASMTKLMLDVTELLDEGEDFDAERMRLVFINLHTMKGMSRTFDLKDLTAQIHKAEDYVKHVQSDSSQWNYEMMRKEIADLKFIFDEYSEVYAKTIIGRDQQGYLLPKELFFECLDVMQSMINGPKDRFLLAKSDECIKAMRRLFNTEMHVLIQDLEMQGRSLSQELNKIPPRICFEGEDVLLQPEDFELLSQVFTHLLRNSLDHGIESAELRHHKGKEPQGSIFIKLHPIRGEELMIEFSDDGAGINLAKVKAKALQQGMIDTDKTYQPLQIAMLILQPGFSTSETINQISGRGVGMDAVSRILQRRGGELGMTLSQSSAGQDFLVPVVFAIKFPMSHMHRLAG